jgi:hypothetical protein
VKPVRVERNACNVWLAKLKEGDPVEDIENNIALDLK